MTSDPRRHRAPRLALITSVGITVRAFCLGQLKALSDAGIECTVVCAADTSLGLLLDPRVGFVPLDLGRVIAPVKDLRTLIALYRLLKRGDFDIVQYATPKAALLGSIAAAAARIPNRIYCLWGLYHDGQRGLRRRAFAAIERLICALSTEVHPNSFEMRTRVVDDGMVSPERCQVLGHGSACGIDLVAFDPARAADEGRRLRASLSLPPDAVAIGFFGRLVGDKGLTELIQAFATIAAREPRAHLLVVGQEEQKDPVPDATLAAIREHPRIHHSPWQDSLVPCYAAIDILCAPSYREGFPQAPLEAQAMVVPVVATDIMGCREAVVAGATGFLVRPRSAEALVEPLAKLIANPELRRAMGARGRERVVSLFDARDLEAAIVRHRLTLLEGSGRAAGASQAHATDA